MTQIRCMCEVVAEGKELFTKGKSYNCNYLPSKGMVSKDNYGNYQVIKGDEQNLYDAGHFITDVLIRKGAQLV